MTTTTVTLPTAPTVTLWYYLEVKDGGIIQTYPGTAFEKRRKHVPHDIKVNDMRPARDEFTIDKCGFQLVNHKSAVKDFGNEEHTKEVWYPEVKSLIKKVTGANDVHIISHMTRQATTADSQEDAKDKKDTDFVTLNNPARFVHVDQSYRGAEQLLFLNLPEEEAERRLKKRWAIVNVWAPINKPVKRDPLAFCDFRTIDENDFRTVVANLPPRGKGEYGNVSKNLSHKARAEYSSNGETSARYEVTNLAHNPGQKWYYASDMTPEEAWVFKIFDSKTDGRARCAVHSSFPYKDQPERGEPRTSVEIRTFVFWDDEEST
ncbi:hypothetical protein LTR10_022605 [Elasticomyces elasticus]|uniref:GA4 desaturase family protein n=1 Tax=Exophiala sideris TaxID=1016849 RepID=A0ABR0IZ55_9EURO|nr:hypothetical protein LTR10_022605 [Elasticomyces elasticus]KAK5022639.1 hypothetical protein LTS07_009862 [Exophiala sideris]KAK5027696.1 hypothetical protein LTR13_009403 [Exophiala sideris]KAK5052215.1 hypothetical protein LTR69_009977 [Exophiala sideris]KAK5177987.1 hypothetical protein LTR44_009536 [Eurotiomycetes sp. CCFEE 6388]